MLWQHRHDAMEANVKGLVVSLRGNATQASERKPALPMRLVGPEPSAA
jgi:hypothetical protein